MTEQRFLSMFEPALISGAVEDREFIDKWNAMQRAGELIALMHSELSEALEAARHGNPPDDKIPEFTGLEAELGDTVIRIMDFAQKRGLRVG